MTALERIKEIDISNRMNGPIPDGTIIFLIQAFKRMRGIAVNESYCHDSPEISLLYIDKEFEKQMSKQHES